MTDSENLQRGHTLEQVEASHGAALGQLIQTRRA